MSKLIRRIIKETIDEFDWVDTDTSNLAGQRLYDVMTELFVLQDYKYYITTENGIIEISDNSGLYLEYNMEDFTINRVREDLYSIINDYNMGPSIRSDYSNLAKTLAPIIGPMEYYH
jgi:hypothetical protein